MICWIHVLSILIYLQGGHVYTDVLFDMNKRWRTHICFEIIEMEEWSLNIHFIFWRSRWSQSPGICGVTFSPWVTRWWGHHLGCRKHTLSITELDSFDEIRAKSRVSIIWNKTHYVNFAMRWGTASKRASRRCTAPKRDSSLIGHWMGHLLSYSLSGGHNGAMLPINPRGLNGPLTSHFIFSSHMYFSLNTPTHYWSPMPN